MKDRTIFLLILIFAIIFSINLVSASNIEDNSTMLEDSSESVDLSSVDEINADYELSDSSENDFISQDDDAIWVGPNTNNGNGSENNPFKNFDSACSSIGAEKEKVTIKVKSGTYKLGSHLKFNTKNMHIIGVEDNVIITYEHEWGDEYQQAFGLIPTTGNFTMSNIRFDGDSFVPDYDDFYDNSFVSEGCFCPFIGTGNYVVTLENCTFVECMNLIATNGQPYYPFIFNKCTFIASADDTCYRIGALIQHNGSTFKNCIFNIDCFNPIINAPLTVNVSLEDCWFGINGIPGYFYTAGTTPLNFNFISYAEFKISENYLGNNTYEIIGNLFRNGTSELITGINPMEVTLSSDDNGLNQTKAILKNGTFKVLYTSTSANHKITATFDQAVEPVEFKDEFKSINISLDSPIIKYGDKQNITVTLPSEYNGIIYVTVNGKTYNKTVEFPKLTTTIDISDVLPVGTYDVNVTFVDKIDNETCAVYGYNTTTITVSKVSEYDFNATITPTTVYLGDNATVTLILPDGATGNVTIKVGENNAITFNTTDSITINGFVAGDNVVNITYNGNEKYDPQSVVKNITAFTKPTTITTINVTTTYNVAKNLVITLIDVNGKVLANKTINVVVGTINENLTTNTSGQASVNIATLAPDTYVANITFVGDEVYAKSNATVNVVVNKIASSITASKVTATYNVAKNLVITLTANGKPLSGQKVTVKVGTISKTLTTDAKGQVSVDVSKLTPKTYTATFTYAGDSINAGLTNTAKVVVNKATPKLTAKKATFKAKKKTKKYSIVLKDNKGKAIKKAKVTLKVKGKTYKATTNNKGKATFKITKLNKKGKATATIKFAGNTLYKAVTKKAKLTVKK